MTVARLIGRRLSVALAVVALVVGAAASPPEAAAVSGSITGMFVDGWYPESFEPSRPLNLDPTTMTAVTDSGAVIVEGTAVETGTTLNTTVFGPAGDGGPLPTVGSSGSAFLFGAVSACGSGLEGHADILQASYNGPTVVAFAATVYSRCSSGNPMPGYVRVEVRYHSTIGFRGFRVTPLVPPFGVVPPDLDLGEVHVGDPPATGAFTITNTGSLALAVDAGTPTDATFSVVGSTCDGSALGAGAQCSIDVSFEPVAAGQRDAIVPLLTPELPRTERPLRVRGTGIQATTLEATVADTSTILTSEAGLTWFDLDWTPADMSGYVDIVTTCGANAFLAVNPTTPHQVPIVPALPAGPCSATIDLSGGAYVPSHVELDFVVGSYVDLHASTHTTGNIIGAGQPFDLWTTVAAVNGASPTGGSVTVTDLGTDAVLVDRPVTGATLEAANNVAGLPAGVHAIRIHYSGDGAVEPWTRDDTIVVDGDAPEGSVAIDDGAGYTDDPSVTLGLTADDPTSDVVDVRLSNSPATAGGVLVEGTTMGADSLVDWDLAAADGSRSVYVQWRDAVGHWSTPTSDAIVLDRVDPVVTTPTAAIVSGALLSSGRVPARVTFGASDARSGLASSAVQVSRDGGAWITAGSGTARTIYLTPGHAYRFRGVATDRAGNSRLGSSSATINVATIQESAPAVTRRGTWSVTPQTGALGGKVARSSTVGSSLTWTGTARQIALIGPLGLTSGTARVYVDGVYRTTITMSGATPSGPRVRYAIHWSVAGTHSIRVVVRSGVVKVDAFARW
jgi:hypothetical protein